MKKRALILTLLAIACLSGCKHKQQVPTETSQSSTEASTEAPLDYKINAETLPTTEVLIGDENVTVTVLETNEATGTIVGKIEGEGIYAQSATLPDLSTEYDLNSESRGQQIDNIIVQWCESKGTLSDTELIDMMQIGFEDLSEENKTEILKKIKSEYPQGGIQETESVTQTETDQPVDEEAPMSLEEQKELAKAQAQNRPEIEYVDDNLTGYDESMAAESNLVGQ